MKLYLFYAVLAMLTTPKSYSQSVQPTYAFVTNNGTITITAISFPLTFKGPAGPITLPSRINGLPVTALGEAFSGIFSSYLTSIAIPNTITNIGDFAFEDDLLLTNISFLGNAPAVGAYSFETHAQQLGNPTTAYFLAGTSGWVYDCTLPSCGMLNLLASDGAQAKMLPSISLTISSTNGLVPLTVNLTSSGTDSEGDPVSQRNWSFGDGSTSTLPGPTHTYSNAGIFSIALIETNSYGFPVAGSVGPSIIVTPLFKTLHSFNGNTDGAGPSAGLILGSSLFGTADQGGGVGYGTVFKVNVDGTDFLVLHTFTNGLDGAYPGSLLALGDTLYGAASSGGTNGTGNVFSIKTNGTNFKVLHSFGATVDPFSYFYINADGGQPAGQLAVSGQTLYGSAVVGGTNGYGTVFSINTDGTGFRKLYDFSGGSDGSQPIGGLTVSGNTLYGTTFAGGNSTQAGTIFSINTYGSNLTTLYSFTGGMDGVSPVGGLTLSGSILYGTASSGGTSGSGTLFGIFTNGSQFGTLHSFSPTLPGNAPFYTNADGYQPSGQLSFSGGALYGTAPYGGSSGIGTIFKVNADGTSFVVLYNFMGWHDGIIPSSELLVSGSTAYGTAGAAGDSFGTIFSVSLGPSSSGSETLSYPAILPSSLGEYAATKQAAFAIAWATNGSIVAETSTNLATRLWFPIATNILRSGVSQFIDPTVPNSPARFYRVRAL